LSAIDELCPHCGLCCNGVLFGDVELQAGDDSNHLAVLGLKLHPKGKTKAFDQPCACLVGGLCRIYDSRPKRCRAFDCAALKRVQAGSLSIRAARRAITAARRQADEVLRLVRALGDSRETVPLNRRYSDLMSQPIDFSDDESHLELRGELMLAVGKLVDALNRDFLAGK
jgi:Fe-S-cluster containining protein